MKLICASSIPIGHFTQQIELCFTAQQSTKTKIEHQVIAMLKNQTIFWATPAIIGAFCATCIDMAAVRGELNTLLLCPWMSMAHVISLNTSFTVWTAFIFV